MVRTVVVASLIALALCHDAAAGLGTQRSAAIAVTHRAAGAHAARRSRPAAAQTRPIFSPGPPPEPGYCWYYIDRATRSPGFWDLCRQR
jgi:hypothetical protein